MMEVCVPAHVSARADLARLDQSVASRCASHLNRYDREDVTGDLLLEAVAAAVRLGSPMRDGRLEAAPVLALAVRASRRPRYYARASRRAALRLEEQTPRSHDAEGDEPDYRGLDSVPAPGDLQEGHAVLDLVGRLPAAEKQALWLCAVQGCTVREASRALGIPESTFHDRLLRARGSVRHAIAEAEAA